MPTNKKKSANKSNFVEDENEMPEDVRKVKDKLEKETGKKYKYRPAKKDLPSVGELLAHGVPGEDGETGYQRQRTWMETFGYPLILALLFLLSFWISMNIPHYKGKKHTLPKMMNKNPHRPQKTETTSPDL